ncbi:MAG: hypothetical protein DRI69_09945 [Bacteroidetes bacterium]|nr:MAG: hypothetical protein DRI69_09945 [Bacteroidota bacterium]
MPRSGGIHNHVGVDNQHMKQFITVLTFSILPLAVNSQIPNAGFEQWDSIENYEKPLGWITNQSQELTRLQRDTARVEGQYSLKLFPSTGSWFDVCESHLITTVKIDQQYQVVHSLYFYYKIIPDSTYGYAGAFLHSTVRVFNKDGTVELISSTITEETPEFTEIEIPLLHTTIDSIRISFSGGARSHGAADICYLRSFAWIDNLSIKPSSVTSTEHINTALVSVFPNPSRGILHIDGNWRELQDYTVYSILGDIVAHGTLSEPRIQINEPGIYVLVLTDPRHLKEPVVSKIVIQK